VHLLVSEPEQKLLATAMQSVNQSVSRQARTKTGEAFWQARYHDFNVRTEAKLIEKLDYMHDKPGDCLIRRRSGSGAAIVT
jgi:REP element-mobilizing transposase RayT